MVARFVKNNTIEGLKEFILKVIKKNDEIVDNLASLLICREECIGLSKLMGDLSKYDFHFEEVILEDDIPNVNKEYSKSLIELMGYNDLDGIVFYGVLAGTDYGIPLYFIIYEDDKGVLRGYIPSKGNSINPYSKTPFGEDDDADNKFAVENGFESIWKMDEEEYTFLDSDLLKRDILKRLKVK